MSKNTQRSIRLAGQRLLSIVIAMPVAVLAGLAAVFLLDTILPHGKGWQLPAIFLGAFISAGVAGVACLRAIGPRRIPVGELDVPHPLDKP